MKHANKTVLVWSPVSSVGKSIVASYVAYSFAKQGSLVALIELNRYVSSTNYILDATGSPDSSKKSLKTAINSDSERTILDNFVQNRNSENLFTLTLNDENLIDDLYYFDVEKIKKVIQVAKSNFDIVIIEVPSNYIEAGLVASLDVQFDKFVQVLDNNLVTWKALKLYDIFLREFDGSGISCINQYNTITVINKDEGFINSEVLSKMQDGLTTLKPVPDNTFKIPYYKNIIKFSNESLISFLDALIPGSKRELQIKRSIKSIVSAIQKDDSKKFMVTLKLKT